MAERSMCCARSQRRDKGAVMVMAISLVVPNRKNGCERTPNQCGAHKEVTMEAMVQGESSSPGKKYHRVAVTRHGGPDVLRVVEADLPERRAGEVRVNVLAPQFLPTISCSGAKVLPPARRACRSPQERTSLAWWAQVDTVNEAA